MTVTFEVYFKDLTAEAQKDLLEKFKTTEKDENWDVVPLTVIEREVDDPYP
ncbi:hypothetical protein ACFLYZ_00700 [Thermodesulfobacteriota bacterium]